MQMHEHTYLQCFIWVQWKHLFLVFNVCSFLDLIQINLLSFKFYYYLFSYLPEYNTNFLQLVCLLQEVAVKVHD